MKKKAVCLICLFFLAGNFFSCPAQEDAEQTVADFNLSGFGDQGKKSWELSGKSADIFSDTIKVKDISGKLYGENEDILLTAQQGDFDKKQSAVHLEKDVVITTSGGAKLTTDSLDWDRKNQIISTKDPVSIKRETMVTTATGAVGHPDLNKISLTKDVTVEINPQDKKEPLQDLQDKVVITCDGPLEIDYQKNVAVFNNNVKVEQKDVTIYSDIMDVYFLVPDKNKAEQKAEAPSVMGANLDRIVSRGNVKIVRGENISYCEQAVYTAADKKIILTGRPKLVIYSREDFSAASGN
jgi:LPS export ABC transporter protein LptC